jgi:hypothetical protein
LNDPPQPPTGSTPQPSLEPADIRAIEAFASWCDTKADRARSLLHTTSWRQAARLARQYIRSHS